MIDPTLGDYTGCLVPLAIGPMRLRVCIPFLTNELSLYVKMTCVEIQDMTCPVGGRHGNQLIAIPSSRPHCGCFRLSRVRRALLELSLVTQSPVATGL